MHKTGYHLPGLKTQKDITLYLVHVTLQARYCQSHQPPEDHPPFVNNCFQITSTLEQGNVSRFYMYFHYNRILTSMV